MTTEVVEEAEEVARTEDEVDMEATAVAGVAEEKKPEKKPKRGRYSKDHVPKDKADKTFLLRVEHALAHDDEPKRKDLLALCEEHRALTRQLEDVLARYVDWRELERFVRIKAASPSTDLDAEISAVLRRLKPE